MTDKIQLAIARAPCPDNTGGFDYAAYDPKTGHIYAEFYEHVGHGPAGGFVKLDAKTHVEMFVKVFNGDAS
jgi:hypothetical protein